MGNECPVNSQSKQTGEKTTTAPRADTHLARVGRRSGPQNKRPYNEHHNKYARRRYSYIVCASSTHTHTHTHTRIHSHTRRNEAPHSQREQLFKPNHKTLCYLLGFFDDPTPLVVLPLLLLLPLPTAPPLSIASPRPPPPSPPPPAVLLPLLPPSLPLPLQPPVARLEAAAAALPPPSTAGYKSRRLRPELLLAPLAEERWGCPFEAFSLAGS